MGYPAVDSREFLRQAALIKRLPAMADELRRIVKTVDALK